MNNKAFRQAGTIFYAARPPFICWQSECREASQSNQQHQEGTVTKQTVFFAIKLEGPDVQSSRVRLEDFLRLGQEMLRAVERVALVLQGSADSQKAGRRPQDLHAAVALDLVGITHGSPSAVIQFERSAPQSTMPSVDFGLQAYEALIRGMSAVLSDQDTTPTGFDPGVLLAIRDAGRLFDRGVDRIEFTLNSRHHPMKALYNREGYARVQKRIVGPQLNKRTLEGRLIMADFKERGPRLRVHPSSGGPVICLFDESLRDEVYRSILHFVRVTGEAKEDPISKKIVSITVSDIERIEAKEDQMTEILPSGAPLPGDFWAAMSFEELAEGQGVGPLTHIDALVGVWPGDVNDDFEESVHKLRQAN